MFYNTNIYNYAIERNLSIFYLFNTNWLCMLAKYDNIHFSHRFHELNYNDGVKIMKTAVDNDSRETIKSIYKNVYKWIYTITKYIISSNKIYLFDDIKYPVHLNFNTWQLNKELLDQLYESKHKIYNDTGLIDLVTSTDNILFLDYLLQSEHSEFLSYVGKNKPKKIIKQLLIMNFTVNYSNIIDTLLDLDEEGIRVILQFYDFNPNINYRYDIPLKIFKILENYPFDFSNNITKLIITNKQADYIFENYNTSDFLAIPYYYLSISVVERVIFYKSFTLEDWRYLYIMVRSGHNDKIKLLLKHFGMKLIVEDNYRMVSEAISYDNFELLYYIRSFMPDIMNYILQILIRYRNIRALEKYLKIAEIEREYSNIKKIINNFDMKHCVSRNTLEIIKSY